jgi:hypothetical protein
MKGKEIAILFFIIAVLAFYIFSEKGEKTHYKLPELPRIENSDVSRMTIKKKDGTITLLKEQEKWFVGEKKYPADESRVKGMIQKIASLKLTDLIAESGNYARYELDDEHGIEVSIFKGDDLLRHVLIGKPASSYRHTFVRIGDDPRVYHSEGNFRAEFNRSISDLRDRKVLAISEEITDITLKKGDRELKMVRVKAPVSEDTGEKETSPGGADEEKAQWTTVDGRAVKSEEIEKIVNSLSNFMCDGFIEDRKKEDFNSPSYKITLKGINEFSISFFDKKDAKYQAVSSYSEYPFLVSEWKAKQLMKDFKDLLEEGDRPAEAEKKGP